MENTYVACLNYNDPDKRLIMEDKFKYLDLKVKFCNGVKSKDRLTSIKEGHCKMIEWFLQSSKDYLLVFEDDVVIHKDFKNKFNQMMKKNKHCDLILLGYLTNTSNLTSLKDLWGTQCYCINREYATWFLDEYNFFDDNVGMDSLITKKGKDIYVVYPPLVIEDGKSIYELQCQQNFHDECHKFCMTEDFI
jgi:hypothetical protein